jgi:hypothetical protein
MQELIQVHRNGKKVVEMCDKVISSGAFSLMPAVLDNFASPTQAASTEIISAFTKDATQNAGNNQFILYTQNGLDQLKYGLPFSPANGYSSTQAALYLPNDTVPCKGATWIFFPLY